jgi:DNA helicase-2/ATP-dependent DNA helicase PcrA
MTFSELRDLLGAEHEEQQTSVLADVLERLGENTPDEGTLTLSPRVRIMTMHGAKGLSGHIVFIPGLEEAIFPGEKRKPYTGLLAEAARMLYVSITRARAACVISFAITRMVNGAFSKQTPSRFASQIGGAFMQRESGLTTDEVSRIVTDCEFLDL